MSPAFQLGCPRVARRWVWPRRVWLLMCQLVGCLVLFGAGSAWAAPGPSIGAEEPAPMCDPDGASVVAREDIPEVDHGHFEALPCEAQLLMAGWRLDAPEFGCRAASFDDRGPVPPSPPPMPHSRYEAARELAAPFPERGEPSLAPLDDGEGLAPSRGHERLPFRPPVARA